MVTSTRLPVTIRAPILARDHELDQIYPQSEFSSSRERTASSTWSQYQRHHVLSLGSRFEGLTITDSPHVNPLEAMWAEQSQRKAETRRLIRTDEVPSPQRIRSGTNDDDEVHVPEPSRRMDASPLIKRNSDILHITAPSRRTDPPRPNPIANSIGSRSPPTPEVPRVGSPQIQPETSPRSLMISTPAQTGARPTLRNTPPVLPDQSIDSSSLHVAPKPMATSPTYISMPSTPRISYAMSSPISTPRGTGAPKSEPTTARLPIRSPSHRHVSSSTQRFRRPHLIEGSPTLIPHPASNLPARPSYTGEIDALMGRDIQDGLDRLDDISPMPLASRQELRIQRKEAFRKVSEITKGLLKTVDAENPPETIQYNVRETGKPRGYSRKARKSLTSTIRDTMRSARSSTIMRLDGLAEKYGGDTATLELPTPSRSRDLSSSVSNLSDPMTRRTRRPSKAPHLLSILHEGGRYVTRSEALGTPYGRNRTSGCTFNGKILVAQFDPNDRLVDSIVQEQCQDLVTDGFSRRKVRRVRRKV